jgi:hypothetical protein
MDSLNRFQLYLKIDRRTYLRARKTSIMKRPLHGGDLELHTLLTGEPESKEVRPSSHKITF